MTQPEIDQKALEATAKAITTSRGVDPDTLFQINVFTGDEPFDHEDDRQRRYEYAWRRSTPAALAAIAAYLAALQKQEAVPTAVTLSELDAVNSIIDRVFSASPQTVGVGMKGREDLKERLAAYIAIDWDQEIDPVVGASWPEREGDDGYRGNGGYITIQPSDVLVRCREQANRLLNFLGLASLETGAVDPSHNPGKSNTSGERVSGDDKTIERNAVVEECAKVVERLALDGPDLGDTIEERIARNSMRRAAADIRKLAGPNHD